MSRNLVRGRYEIVDVVGRGGEGEVVRATDVQLGRTVAIKIRRVDEHEGRDRILAEARVLFELRPHEGLPLAREDFFEADRYHLVMDWVEGESLQRVLDLRGDPGLTFGSVLGYLEQVAESLEHLHSHDPPVVHGDVKPQNLIVSGDGRLVLVDFGIARRASARASGAGTAAFIAPEVAAGEAVGPAADVYSLAATAVALLTGAPPQGVRPEWGGIPERGQGPVERALRSGLSTDPSRRPRARELVERLRSWLEALPTGTITFLMTDVEGSTRLWESEPEAMRLALASHDRLIAEAVEGNSGALVRSRGEGDSHFAVFRAATDAAGAVDAIQRGLLTVRWQTSAPISIRASLHTGEAELRDGSYYGTSPNRCARLRAIAHGGQTLVSQATANLIRDALPAGARIRSLGVHRLKDLARPEEVFELIPRGVTGQFPPLRSLDAAPNNLPVQLTSFVGRREEQRELGKLMAEDRLVTLTGAGGVGKTRLALQVAAETLDGFIDGAYLVDVGVLEDGDLVAGRVASTLGIREQPDRTVTEAVIEALRDSRMLLVLDGCEHLIDACADLVHAVLRSCPGLRILATSRQQLGIDGERTWQVPTLATTAGLASGSSLADMDAVRLFVDRAALVSRGFEVTEDRLGPIGSICRQLDGIPLAIELAAGLVNILTVEQIDERLENRFALLSHGSRRALPRHRTLHEVVGWSHDLLSDAERVLFRRLAVFAGGWTLGAAEGVCADEDVSHDAVLHLLAGLVDKSLVSTEERRSQIRYRMLDTIRAYALERLRETEEEPGLRAQHLDLFLSLAEDVEPRLSGSGQAEALVDLDAEHDNMRAGLAWAIGQGRTVDGLTLASALARFWQARGHLSEGGRWLESSLAHSDEAPADLRARAAERAGVLAAAVGNQARAREHFELSLETAREAGDERGQARTLARLGHLATSQGDYGTAAAVLGESVQIARRLDDAAATSEALRSLGINAYYQADYETARRFWEESLSLERVVGNQAGLAHSLSDLGAAALEQGDYEDASRFQREALEIRRELGDRSGISASLANVGELAAISGDTDEAVRVLDESLSIAREIGDLPALAFAALTRGAVAIDQAEPDTAQAYLRESLTLSLDLGDKQAVARCLEELAAVLVARDRPRDAAQVFGFVGRWRVAISSPLPPSLQPRVAALEDRLARLLPRAELESLKRSGAAMRYEDAAPLALPYGPDA